MTTRLCHQADVERFAPTGCTPTWVWPVPSQRRRHWVLHPQQVSLRRLQAKQAILQWTWVWVWLADPPAQALIWAASSRPHGIEYSFTMEKKSPWKSPGRDKSEEEEATCKCSRRYSRWARVLQRRWRRGKMRPFPELMTKDFLGRMFFSGVFLWAGGRFNWAVSRSLSQRRHSGQAIPLAPLASLDLPLYAARLRVKDPGRLGVQLRRFFQSTSTTFCWNVFHGFLSETAVNEWIRLVLGNIPSGAHVCPDRARDQPAVTSLSLGEKVRPFPAPLAKRQAEHENTLH